MIHTVLLVLLVAAQSAQSAHAAQAGSGSGSMQLGTVEVTGVQRYAQADVARLSGLEVGKAITRADLDAATKRLAGTGLFKEVSYRYQTVAGKTIVTFAIVEPEWTMPVIFDNFVWFKDDEIIAALRPRIPSFDGTAPILEGVSELLTRELQALLHSRTIPGKVEFMPQATMDGTITAFLFKVVDPATKVCALHFTGVAAIKEASLAEHLPIVGTDYSRSFILHTVRGSLTDVYRQGGYWRATFETPAVVMEQTPACNGVSVTLAVQEGARYAADGVTWTGNTTIASRELDAMMPLKAGDTANVAKLDDGLRQVHAAYGKHGYVALKATYKPRLDDEKRRAAFDISIDEGPQFHFGTVAFPGLSDEGVSILVNRWRLKAGDVFDASYPMTFFMNEVQPRLPPGKKPPAVQSQVDAEKHVINVKFEFGS